MINGKLITNGHTKLTIDTRSRQNVINVTKTRRETSLRTTKLLNHRVTPVVLRSTKLEGIVTRKNLVTTAPKEQNPSVTSTGASSNPEDSPRQGDLYWARTRSPYLFQNNARSPFVYKRASKRPTNGINVHIGTRVHLGHQINPTSQKRARNPFKKVSNPKRKDSEVTRHPLLSSSRNPSGSLPLTENVGTVVTQVTSVPTVQDRQKSITS